MNRFSHVSAIPMSVIFLEMIKEMNTPDTKISTSNLSYPRGRKSIFMFKVLMHYYCLLMEDIRVNKFGLLTHQELNDVSIKASLSPFEDSRMSHSSLCQIACPLSHQRHFQKMERSLIGVSIAD